MRTHIPIQKKTTTTTTTTNSITRFAFGMHFRVFLSLATSCKGGAQAAFLEHLYILKTVIGEEAKGARSLLREFHVGYEATFARMPKRSGGKSAVIKQIIDCAWARKGLRLW